jgi:molybdate/tungstate transport system ATP-binding protein
MISVRNLSLRLGRLGAFALDGVSFDVPQGAYAVLMGRTGTGKTTILEAIAGLRRPASGAIFLGGRDVTGLPPGQRGVGYVPQDRVLFNTMSVYENIAFALSIQKRPHEEIDQRVNDLAAMLGVTHLLHRQPQGLSGGEAQRVALGRALAGDPAVLLLDEPLSALDDDTREEMHELLCDIRSRTHVTTLHVTHHRSDADRLGTCVLVLADGAVKPVNSPCVPEPPASQQPRFNPVEVRS